MVRNCDEPSICEFILANFILVDGYIHRKNKCIGGTRPVPGAMRNGYRTIKINYAFVQTHNAVAILKTGIPIPFDMVCDHIDGDVDNNHESNIRIVSRSLNSRNKSPRGSVKFLCVVLTEHGTYRVQYYINKVRHYVGMFSDVASAVLARDLSMSVNDPDRLHSIKLRGF